MLSAIVKWTPLAHVGQAPPLICIVSSTRRVEAAGSVSHAMTPAHMATDDQMKSTPSCQVSQALGLVNVDCLCLSHSQCHDTPCPVTVSSCAEPNSLCQVSESGSTYSFTGSSSAGVVVPVDQLPNTIALPTSEETEVTFATVLSGDFSPERSVLVTHAHGLVLIWGQARAAREKVQRRSPGVRASLRGADKISDLYRDSCYHIRWSAS